MAATPLRIAHRGMPRRERENTLPSFAAALAAGAEAIELDVHATADGEVVVHHDPTTAGGLEIARSHWSLLEPASAAEGVQIPTLAAVCALVGDQAELMVEIKGAGIEVRVLEVLERHEGASAIHSFDHAMIGRLARRRPRQRLGLLIENEVEDVPALLSAHGARDAWPHRSLVDQRLVDAVHRAGARVLVWTVNDPREIDRLRALRV